MKTLKIIFALAIIVIANDTFASNEKAVQLERKLNSTPLVVIKFDSANVEYKKGLKKAVTAAYNISKSTSFSLVAVRPDVSDKGQRSKFLQQSSKVGEQVKNDIIAMNIPASQVSVRYQQSKKISANEVRVFVY
jgi:hypothetical protein